MNLVIHRFDEGTESDDEAVVLEDRECLMLRVLTEMSNGLIAESAVEIRLDGKPLNKRDIASVVEKLRKLTYSAKPGTLRHIQVGTGE